jgi:hypothetical protein
LSLSWTYTSRKKTWYDTLDNVYWGVGTGEPSPKLSWLRYIRWQRYFLHLKLSGITRTPADMEPIKCGPPNLRDRDKERMALTNCFAMNTSTGQFEANNVGCHDAWNPRSPFPQFPNVNDDLIILYQYKSIWTMDLNDYDCNTKWNASFSMYHRPCLQERPLSIRQEKLRAFIANRHSKWGRKSTFDTATDTKANDGSDWALAADYASYIANHDSVGQDSRPPKQQKLDKDEV